ncbi:MAG: hypothetical protein L3K24_04260 [Gammaproteobacteria bacterium]|nr:hypothetical protein [Gammaproteobacteria bacterium]
MEFDYITTDYLDVSTIKRVPDQLRAVLPLVESSAGEEEQNIYIDGLDKEQLASFPNLVGLSDFTLEGYLTMDPVPWFDLSDVIRKIDKQIIKFGVCMIDIGYEERNSSQSKDAYDVVGLRLDRGKVYFLYSANGSLVCADNSYKREVVGGLIHHLGLDVSIEDGEGYFKLASQGRELKITRSGLFGKNPHGFVFELEEQGAGKLVEKLRSALDYLSSGKVITCSWRCFPRSMESTPYQDNLFEFFDLVRRQPLPAESYDLSVSIMASSIDDCEGLRTLCKDDDVIFTPLVGFNTSDKYYGEIRVRTTKEGHRLWLTLKNLEDIEMISEATGLEFKEF